MAPGRASSRQPFDDIDESGRAEFESTLTEFGQQRGIPIDFNTKVAGRHIDLYRLFKVINSRGGYDAVSAEKLAWRRLGDEFELGTANAAAYAFALKTTYYKNLAAYELKFIHNKEPPPTSILEEVTAKGADILNRTVENFQFPKRYNNIRNGDDQESDGLKTPKADKMDIDEPDSGAGRTTRGLRQQPPQRVLFQPDVSSSKMIRHTSTASPQPTFPPPAPMTASNPTTFTVANYEPRPQMPLSLRPIVTPNGNFQLFQSHVKRLKELRLAAVGLGPTPTVMKPGAGFEGPNIYVRILNSLRSPLEAEQDYALHHMVKISHERGDKYRFDSFPGLADGLIERLLSVSSLFYDVEWQISYDEEPGGVDVLDGINSTSDILQKIQALDRLDTCDELHSANFAHRMNKNLEAALTLRNLAMLEENAAYLSEMAQLRDWLSIALNLPPTPEAVEMKHYVLEVAEQVVRYWRMPQQDPLYQSLLQVVNEGQDRGATVTALKALRVISRNLEEQNMLPGVPVSVLRNIFEWIALEDEEFTTVCLDFLHQYTAFESNILFMFQNCNDLPLSPLTTQLSRLLQYKSKPVEAKSILTRAVPVTPATEVPSVPKDLLDQFLRHEEPERSKMWLRSVFEEDAQSHITQIALWQSYQGRFSDHVNQSPLLQAAEFIKNVSSVFSGANAQVVQETVQKFIIKGIRPRHAPVDNKGRVYSRCKWHHPDSMPCDEYQLKPRHMHDHIARKHLHLNRKEGGAWDLDGNDTELPNDCYWADCRHFERRNQPKPSAKELALHVKTHLPDTTTKSAYRQKHNRSPATQIVPLKMVDGKIQPATTVPLDTDHGREATHKVIYYHNTLMNEVGNADGVAWTSALILRNFARNTPKAMALIDGVDTDSATKQAMEGLFGHITERLMYVTAYNRPLSGWMSEIIALVEKGLR